MPGVRRFDEGTAADRVAEPSRRRGCEAPSIQGLEAFLEP